MPEPLTTYIVNYHYACYAYSAIMQNLYNDVLNLQTALVAEGNPSSGNAAGLMAVHVWELRNKFTYGADSVRYWNVLSLQYIDNNAFNGGGGEVTMDAMLNAMLSSTFTQLTSWMGITQAFKVAVWDAPFNEEYYAALARGFKIWGP